MLIRDLDRLLYGVLQDASQTCSINVQITSIVLVHSFHLFIDESHPLSAFRIKNEILEFPVI